MRSSKSSNQWKFLCFDLFCCNKSLFIYQYFAAIWFSFASKVTVYAECIKTSLSLSMPMLDNKCMPWYAQVFEKFKFKIQLFKLKYLRVTPTYYTYTCIIGKLCISAFLWVYFELVVGIKTGVVSHVKGVQFIYLISETSSQSIKPAMFMLSAWIWS